MDYDYYKDANIWYIDNELRFPQGIKYHIDQIDNATPKQSSKIIIDQSSNDLSLNYFLFVRKLWQYRHGFTCDDAAGYQKISKLAMCKYVEDLLQSGLEDKEVKNIVDITKENMRKNSLYYINNNTGGKYSSINQSIFTSGPMFKK